MNKNTLQIPGSGRSRLAIVFTLAWPSICEQILQTLVNYVDTAMVGSLGAHATAAVAVNTPMVWLVNGLLTGMGVGFSVQVAQYIGARKTQAVKETIRQALLAALALGGILLLIFQSLASFLPVWMGAEAAIQSEAIIYLRLIMTVLPCMACSAVFSATLRCMGDTRTPMLLNLGANVLNALLNFLLIYEPRMLRLGGLEFHMWGAGMGVAGAALATAIATGIAGLLMTIAIYRRKGEYKVSLRDSYRPNRLILSTALRLGIPVAMERSVISFGHIALTKVVSKLGTVALAANSIAMSAESFCYLPPNGISFAATTLVGQCMGAGEKDEAQQFGWLCAKSSMFLGIFTGVLLFVVARPLAGFFLAGSGSRSDGRQYVAHRLLYPALLQRLHRADRRFARGGGQQIPLLHQSGQHVGHPGAVLAAVYFRLPYGAGRRMGGHESGSSAAGKHLYHPLPPGKMEADQRHPAGHRVRRIGLKMHQIKESETIASDSFYFLLFAGRCCFPAPAACLGA